MYRRFHLLVNKSNPSVITDPFLHKCVPTQSYNDVISLNDHYKKICYPPRHFCMQQIYSLCPCKQFHFVHKLHRWTTSLILLQRKTVEYAFSTIFHQLRFINTKILKKRCGLLKNLSRLRAYETWQLDYQETNCIRKQVFLNTFIAF